MVEITSEKQIKIENAYGSHEGNWGDRPIFQGDYINFGYWKDIPYGEKITVEERIRSSALLYSYVINNLNVSMDDTVLELGCGRAVGMFDAFMYMNMSKMIGIDISRAQIDRAETKKNRKEKQNLREELEAERIRNDLEFLGKQWELALANIQDEKKEFKQEIKILSQRIDKLHNCKESKVLEQKLDTFANNNIKKETDLEQFKQEWTKDLLENKQKIDKAIEVKNEMARKINVTEFFVASADATGLEDNKIDKIYSIEVFQHIEDFNAIAVEMKRILAPDGALSFCAHLSTSRSSYDKLRQEKLLIDEIEVLAPVDEVVSAFKNNGFNVSHHPIGAYVFRMYEQWVLQVHSSDPVSHNIYESYKSGYIDYYVFVVSKLVGETSNTEIWLNNRDEL